MKFACFGEKPRAADLRGPCSRPRRAAARRCGPRRAGRRGFLKVEPNVLMPDGCASRRRARSSASVAFTVLGVAAARARTTRARRPRRAPGSSGGRRSRAGPGVRRSTPVARSQTSTHSSACAQLAAVGVRVHPHRAADGAGDADAELDPGQAERGRPRGGLRQAGAAAAEEAVGVVLYRGEGSVQFQDKSAKPRSATSRFDPEPTTPTSRPSSRGPRRAGPASSLVRARAGEPARRCRRCGSS